MRICNFANIICMQATKQEQFILCVHKSLELSRQIEVYCTSLNLYAGKKNFSHKKWVNWGASGQATRSLHYLDISGVTYLSKLQPRSLLEFPYLPEAPSESQCRDLWCQRQIMNLASQLGSSHTIDGFTCEEAFSEGQTDSSFYKENIYVFMCFKKILNNC